MAVTTHYSNPRSSLFASLTSWLHTVREQFARHRSYRRTYNELSALSSSQLVDLGLHRSGLQHTAYEAVYGQLR